MQRGSFSNEETLSSISLALSLKKLKSCNYLVLFSALGKFYKSDTLIYKFKL